MTARALRGFLVAAMLAGCGGGEVAGGSGSDLPVYPKVAVVREGSRPMAARAWRLWKVEVVDSAAQFTLLGTQSDTLGGFLLPQEAGTYWVEGWLEGIPPDLGARSIEHRAAAVSRCLQVVQPSSVQADLRACADPAFSPTKALDAGSPAPGVTTLFELPARGGLLALHILATDSVRSSGAGRWRVWIVEPAPASGDAIFSVLRLFGVFGGTSPGVLELALGPGTYAIEGWTAAGDPATRPAYSEAESARVAMCRRAVAAGTGAFAIVGCADLGIDPSFYAGDSSGGFGPPSIYAVVDVP